MDELKLNRWKESFGQEAKNIQTEYNSFFLNKGLNDAYTIKLNESDEWELQLSDDMPAEIKARLQQVFLATKPEDSI